MKVKTLDFALVLALAALPFAAAASEAQTDYTLEGLITEVGDGYFSMDDLTQGEVRVNLDDTTAYDGVAGKDMMAVGQYVYVRYNGIVTRSLPPQVTAEKVSCFVVEGTVSAILDNGFTVEGDALLGTVIVHGGDTLPPVYEGVAITLYYNGVIALSFPPQINAAYAVVPTLTGTVSDARSGGFTLTAEDDAAYAVTVTADTQLSTLPADGQEVLVYYSGETENGVTALAVTLPDAAEAEES